MSDRNEEKAFAGGISRRNFLGTGSVALAGAALSASALAQSPQNVRKGGPPAIMLRHSDLH
jgi:hypothetical protein